MSNAIILLSGGLDSVVSLAKIRNDFNDILALTFDYGQKAFDAEYKSAKKVSDFFNIKHDVVQLNWLKNISTSSLNTDEAVPILNKSDLDNRNITNDSANSVWVPNRNALFLNIAACYCEALDYNYVVIGANKEEAATFKDNSKSFLEAINNSFKQSTNKQIEVLAPLINLSKIEIVKLAIELEIPFDYLYSCYLNGIKHCGKCESCQRLKRALEMNNRYDIISKIFA